MKRPSKTERLLVAVSSASRRAVVLDVLGPLLEVAVRADPASLEEVLAEAAGAGNRSGLLVWEGCAPTSPSEFASAFPSKEWRRPTKAEAEALHLGVGPWVHLAKPTLAREAVDAVAQRGQPAPFSPEAGRYCFFVSKHGYVRGSGFRASVVFEHLLGCFPTGLTQDSEATSDAPRALPYFWGHAHVDALRIAERVNKLTGLSAEQVARIVAKAKAQ